MARMDFSELPYLAVGAMAAIQEELMKAADQLVDKGKSLTPEGRKKMVSEKKGLISRGDDFSQVVARTVQRVLENTGIGTRGDLEELDRRVDALEKKLSAPKKKPATKPAKKAARKPTKKATGKSAKKPTRS